MGTTYRFVGIPRKRFLESDELINFPEDVEYRNDFINLTGEFDREYWMFNFLKTTSFDGKNPYPDKEVFEKYLKYKDEGYAMLDLVTFNGILPLISRLETLCEAIKMTGWVDPLPEEVNEMNNGTDSNKKIAIREKLRSTSQNSKIVELVKDVFGDKDYHFYYPWDATIHGSKWDGSFYMINDLKEAVNKMKRYKDLMVSFIIGY